MPKPQGRDSKRRQVSCGVREAGSHSKGCVMPSPSEHHAPNHGPYDPAALGVPGAAGRTQAFATLMGEHHDLDTVITVLLATGSDELLVSRFKKCKLQVKDQ